MAIENHIEMILRRRFSHVQILESQSIEGEERLLLHRRHLVDALQFLRSDPDTQIDMLVDISAIQHTQILSSCIFSRLMQPPFYEVFYLLRSIRLNHRLRISVMIPEDLASLPTIHPLFESANWLESEIWDLFGIFIEGHPHLRRLLLYAPFAGHPLRKNYPLHKEQPLVPLKPRIR